MESARPEARLRAAGVSAGKETNDFPFLSAEGPRATRSVKRKKNGEGGQKNLIPMNFSVHREAIPSIDSAQVGKSASQGAQRFQTLAPSRYDKIPKG
jgi:hypothetical protein